MLNVYICSTLIFFINPYWLFFKWIQNHKTSRRTCRVLVFTSLLHCYVTSKNELGETYFILAVQNRILWHFNEQVGLIIQFCAPNSQLKIGGKFVQFYLKGFSKPQGTSVILTKLTRLDVAVCHVCCLTQL